MAHYDSEKNRFNPDNRFIGDIEDGKRYPFACYTKEESDAKYAPISVSTDLTALTAEVATKAAQADLTTLSGVVATKAAQSDLTALSGVVDTKAAQSDLTSLSETVSGKASQADLTTLEGTVSDLTTTVSGKASQSDLTALASTVSTKANASDVTSLATVVNTKASAADLAATDNRVSQKANQSTVDALVTAVSGKASQASVDVINTTLSTKANQTALDATNTAVASKANSSDLINTNAEVELKANKSDVATEVANLQNQIDQIEISASAEAVVAPEVAAARVGADGTNYSTLKKRIDGEVTSIHNNLFSFDDGTISFTWEAGGISTSTGAETENPDQIRSNKLYLRKDNPISLNHNLYYYVCKYEADGTFIGYEGSWTGVHVLDLDCAYIRIVIASSNVGDGSLLVSKYTTNSFEQMENNSIVFKSLVPADYDSKLANVLFPCMFNADDTWSDLPDDSETQHMFVCTKGLGSTYMQFAFLLTLPIFYTRIVNTSTATSWVKFDSSNESNTLMYRVPSVTSASRLLSNVLTPCTFNAVSSEWDDLPADESSVIFVNIKGNLGNAYMQFAYPLNASKFYSRVVAPGVVNTWIKYSCSEQSHSGGYPVYTEDKKCGCLGDSITYGLKGTSWVTKLEDYCGFDTVINYGVSGSTIKSNGTNGFLDRYSSMAADLDYIVIWGGVNDFMWTDQTKAEFKANYEALIVGLLNRYPEAKFLAITPMKYEYTDSDAVGIKSTKYDVPRSDGIVLKDYVDAEIEVLNKYSMPYIDFFNVGGISCENAAQSGAYFASSVDKLHPNTNGNLLILAPKISEALKRL